jgi:hypothetical protein
VDVAAGRFLVPLFLAYHSLADALHAPRAIIMIGMRTGAVLALALLVAADPQDLLVGQPRSASAAGRVVIALRSEPKTFNP